MLYRRAPPNPPRLLLRIVATAGTSALLGAAACGGDVAGSAGNVGSDAEAETQRACGVEGWGCEVLPPHDDAESQAWAGSSSGTINFPGGGSMASPGGGSVGFADSGWSARGPCDGRPCPVKAMPSDAGEAGLVDGGVVVSADAGSDVVRPCNGGPCGVILHPEGGLD